MTKQTAMTTILDELHKYTFSRDDFDGKALDTALEVFGKDSVAFDGDYGYALDFAAALEYFIDPEYSGFVNVDDFAVALNKAIETIETDDYFYDPDIHYYYDLGEEIFYRKTKAYRGDFDDYVDFERLGEDIAGDTKGKFTRYGFFAPKTI
ncbi:MAG: hypothetical protein IJ685_04300 [Selenomonadaceae bacterium]|nr:hypothetical protein [Selenomonadaceae bacterium]